VSPGPPLELRATYRLQLTQRFGFAAARELIPYLRDLGISHLYLSPSLQARPGSGHGYDVTDPGTLSEELGGRQEFEQLSLAARQAGLGLILDVVPNHMAADPANRYWADPGLREQFFDIDPASGRHRRFFDIDELAGVRQEDPEVFRATHELVLSLVRGGLVDGLRVDHPDGLADPAEYLERLRAGGASRVWVEKILDPGEHLREWPVCGTVGYEFLDDVCALFVDRRGEAVLTSLWSDVSGDSRPFGEVAFEAKLEQASGTFAPEAQRLERELRMNGDSERLERELRMNGDSERLERELRMNGDSPPPLGAESPFTSRLASALSSLPVYRTYVQPEAGRVEDADHSALAGLDEQIRSWLLLEEPCPPGFITRFQQTTPAIMAKGVEDTAFYRYGRLLALNDVGGDPSRFGIDVEQFHAGCLERAQRFPLNLLTTMTHDAKRSADVRARIAALSTLAGEWREEVERWFELAAPLREGEAPDAVEQYFLFQTLVGVWPIEMQRIETYMEKALREAKRNTAWVDGNPDWEAGVKRFCRALCSHQPFLERMEPFVRRVAAIGDRAALRQVALKLTVPGVPDIYQGDELPYRALVDPDNRRPVDWHWHQAMLRRLMGGSSPDRETWKMFLILRLLGLRARRPEVFASGSYEPLDAGPEVCAFLRGGQVLVAVALSDAPPEASLAVPGGRWHDVLRGEERALRSGILASELLDDRGIAVLER
jgi:(1->4)-alpha-D-glucan 1-alpha-D-glucosylmutase